MNITIRKEKKSDYIFIDKVIIEAFKDDIYSFHNEHKIVNALREEKEFDSEYSLVAIHDNQVVGYVLLSRATLKSYDKRYKVLVLAPLAVCPKFQKKMVGSSLMKKAHQIAFKKKELAIILLGDYKYYCRFGYDIISDYNITIPFEAPDENCMIYPIDKYRLNLIKKGNVIYPDAFYSN